MPLSHWKDYFKPFSFIFEITSPRDISGKNGGREHSRQVHYRYHRDSPLKSNAGTRIHRMMTETGKLTCASRHTG